MCKCLPLSHIAKIHIILIKQTIFSKKSERKGDQVSDLLCPKLPELLYNFMMLILFDGPKFSVALAFNPRISPLFTMNTSSPTLAAVKY